MIIANSQETNSEKYPLRTGVAAFAALSFGKSEFCRYVHPSTAMACGCEVGSGKTPAIISAFQE
jgi:hypothetical protein